MTCDLADLRAFNCYIQGLQCYMLNADFTAQIAKVIISLQMYFYLERFRTFK